MARFSILHREAILHISGPDSLTFLQGQTTCDTSAVSRHQAAIGAYCTPKGRVVCDFILAQTGVEQFALRMRRDIREHAAKVFSKYIVFSKAELDAERDDWLVVGAWGEDIEEALQQAFGKVPTSCWECVCDEGLTLIRTDHEGQHFEIFITADHEKLEKLAAYATACDEKLWQREQIAAGIARIEGSTVEVFVPQVLNYDLTGHISFSKGCYTGQEVVARLHYRGKSKRRTYLANLPDRAASGDPLFSEGSEQSIGNVVNVVQNDDILALVCVAEDALEKDLYLQVSSNETLELKELPYSVESD